MQPKTVSAFIKSSPELKSVDNNWSAISSFLKDCLASLVPSKTLKARCHLPWITCNIKRQMRKRDCLFKKARKDTTLTAWCTYRDYRNKISKAVRHAYCDYINRVVGNNLFKNRSPFGHMFALVAQRTLRFLPYTTKASFVPVPKKRPSH